MDIEETLARIDELESIREIRRILPIFVDDYVARRIETLRIRLSEQTPIVPKDPDHE